MWHMSFGCRMCAASWHATTATCASPTPRILLQVTSTGPVQRENSACCQTSTWVRAYAAYVSLQADVGIREQLFLFPARFNIRASCGIFASRWRDNGKPCRTCHGEGLHRGRHVSGCFTLLDRTWGSVLLLSRLSRNQPRLRPQPVPRRRSSYISCSSIHSSRANSSASLAT